MFASFLCYCQRSSRQRRHWIYNGYITIRLMMGTGMCSKRAFERVMRAGRDGHSVKSARFSHNAEFAFVRKRLSWRTKASPDVVARITARNPVTIQFSTIEISCQIYDTYHCGSYPKTGRSVMCRTLSSGKRRSKINTSPKRDTKLKVFFFFCNFLGRQKTSRKTTVPRVFTENIPEQ